MRKTREGDKRKTRIYYIYGMHTTSCFCRGGKIKIRESSLAQQEQNWHLVIHANLRRALRFYQKTKVLVTPHQHKFILDTIGKPLLC